MAYEKDNRDFTAKHERAKVLKPVSMVGAFALFVPAFLVHGALERVTLGKINKSRTAVSALNELTRPSDMLVDYYKNIDGQLSGMLEHLTAELKQAVIYLEDLMQKTHVLQHREVRKMGEKLA